MVAKNDITGDAIQSKTNSKEYADNFDKIFRKDKKVQEKLEELWSEDDEKRLDIVGQNGPVGYNLEDMYVNGEKDYESR